jgi:histidinol phosphatase-like PHP family hydrolase
MVLNGVKALNIIDLHNHTTFSYDGTEAPEALIENAAARGLDIIGITDHQFTIGSRLPAYIEKIRAMQEKYAGKIQVLCGLEIGTRPKPDDLLPAACRGLDYCLFESLDSPAGMDLFEFLEWRRLFPVPTGLAHTDIFALSARYGVDMLRILREENIFWELNISGNYNYYYDFLTNREKQAAAAAAGITMSVGSDTHRITDFSAKKLRRAHELLEWLGIPLVFDE